MFASEDIGFISTEKWKLGEVSLPEVFSVIGHFKFLIFSLQLKFIKCVLIKTDHVGCDGGSEVHGVVVGGGDEFSGNETS